MTSNHSDSFFSSGKISASLLAVLSLYVYQWVDGITSLSIVCFERFFVKRSMEVDATGERTRPTVDAIVNNRLLSNKRVQRIKAPTIFGRFLINRRGD